MTNPITALRDYVKHSIAELKKVTWPNRDVTVRFSTLVIIVSLIFAIFFAALDYGLQKAVDMVFIPRATAPVPVETQTEPTLLDAEGNPVDATVEGGEQTIQLDDVDAEGDVDAEVTLPPLQ
jgi:preprotein translocase SecE subunit